jgi:hypothetical protein
MKYQTDADRDAQAIQDWAEKEEKKAERKERKKNRRN